MRYRDFVCQSAKSALRLEFQRGLLFSDPVPVKNILINQR
jgi:hypothetical protein